MFSGAYDAFARGAPDRRSLCVRHYLNDFRGSARCAGRYLSRYTHRVAISNRRLITFDETGVTFRYKDYRRDCADRQQIMTLAVEEFIRRFLLHVLPRGFHRIRHYGLLANGSRRADLARVREALQLVPVIVERR